MRASLRPYLCLAEPKTWWKWKKSYYKITFWKRELWLVKSRVSITVWKTWKGSRHYTPSHTPSWTVWRIYASIKKAISTVLVFNGLFYKRNRKHFPPCVPIRYRDTRGSLGGLEIVWKHSPCWLVFPLQFLV